MASSRTPYTETEILLAVLEDDLARAEGLIQGMLLNERRALVQILETTQRLIEAED